MKFIIPKYFMGKPIEGSLEKALAGAPSFQVAPAPQVAQNPPTPANGISKPQDYIILPGVAHGNYSYPDLLVAMNKTHHGKNWYNAHEALSQEGNFMLGIRQFTDFLNLLRTGKAYDGAGKLINSQKIEGILDDIYKVESSWRSEWLDADFKVLDKKFGLFGGKVVMNYEHRIINGKLTPTRKDEVLEGYLDETKNPGIDLADWLTRATYQGLPPSDVKMGSLYYYKPGKDNNSVAGFGAGSGRAVLDCGGDPSGTGAALGVRAARAKN
jgi:hypothetical protein